MRKRTRIRMVLSRVAGALSSSLEDKEPIDEDALGWIRARLSAARGVADAALGAHYLLDVGLLLDEVDRLRYEVGRTPHDDR